MRGRIEIKHWKAVKRQTCLTHDCKFICRKLRDQSEKTPSIPLSPLTRTAEQPGEDSTIGKSYN